MTLTVTVRHHPDERVWYVHESEVPGLHAEAPTLDALVAVIGDLAPELAAANLPSADSESNAGIAVRQSL
ncbi:DUF1902 domain-containing protein [Methylobacterium oxalidis]|uniref:Uncharacterized protein n=1 Tax=Methylobacterium oxalidis TaxID=944322 RepID=A0A512JAI6_9HYPH|nr:DUF1902 domain-containing protein [Methylobacterium oxalidis]GEP06966.1 hypothetical protein MOX02_50040 [Methylobacterium oxalidis]GJE34941.1 hypothetical protein LDDCCGHA_5156 [Methylobacterium oxalidis]GLS62893.1 hypothetical protein GCM10007888_12740 [Methylobacterium oxalidis]